MLDERGREVPDPTPVEVPLRFRNQESSDDRIRRIIRETMSRMAVDSGRESFEEANDFDVDEDPDPVSQYELSDMQEERSFDEPVADRPVDSGNSASPPASSSGGREDQAESVVPQRGEEKEPAGRPGGDRQR